MPWYKKIALALLLVVAIASCVSKSEKAQAQVPIPTIEAQDVCTSDPQQANQYPPLGWLGIGWEWEQPGQNERVVVVPEGHIGLINQGHATIGHVGPGWHQLKPGQTWVLVADKLMSYCSLITQDSP